MRLVEAGTRVFEVHHQGRKVGRVWWYDGSWQAETNAGTAVRATSGASPEVLGRDVVRLHSAGY